MASFNVVFESYILFMIILQLNSDLSIMQNQLWSESRFWSRPLYASNSVYNLFV
jgi:hypothetical protein